MFTLIHMLGKGTVYWVLTEGFNKAKISEIPVLEFLSPFLVDIERLNFNYFCAILGICIKIKWLLVHFQKTDPPVDL